MVDIEAKAREMVRAHSASSEDEATTAIADALREHGIATAEAMREAVKVRLRELADDARQQSIDYMNFDQSVLSSHWMKRSNAFADTNDAIAALPASPPSDPRPDAMPAAGDEVGCADCCSLPCSCAQPDPRPGAETAAWCGDSACEWQGMKSQLKGTDESPRCPLCSGTLVWIDEPAAPQAEPRDEGADAVEQLAAALDAAGATVTYDPTRGPNPRCRTCGKLFREHPGGQPCTAPATRPAGEPVEARPGVVADSASVGEMETEGCGRVFISGTPYRCGYRSSRDYVVLCDPCRAKSTDIPATTGKE